MDYTLAVILMYTAFMSGYSGTPLINKLGIKPNNKIWLINHLFDYNPILEELPEGAVVYTKPIKEADVIHIFTTSLFELENNIQLFKKSIKQNGMIWVSWPKKTSIIQSDLDENKIRDLTLAKGLVDIKVCAIDNNWSGLKLVIRVKDRQ